MLEYYLFYLLGLEQKPYYVILGSIAGGSLGLLLVASLVFVLCCIKRLHSKCKYLFGVNKSVKEVAGKCVYLHRCCWLDVSFMIMRIVSKWVNTIKTYWSTCIYQHMTYHIILRLYWNTNTTCIDALHIVIYQSIAAYITDWNQIIRLVVNLYDL